MKAIILAGGLGTRLSEETAIRPKPMVEIGGKPIIWHIMKMYSYYGINEFIICCGFRGYVIKEYFANYFLHTSDLSINLETNELITNKKRAEPWKIHLVDTGESSMTGGRLLRVKDYVKDDDIFCLTYGDGVGSNNIAATIAFHRSHGKMATLTATYPPARFGAIDLNKNQVKKFNEKPKGDGSLVSAGFFVLSPKVFDFIEDDLTIWEEKPLADLAALNELMAYTHNGFWQPMDTIRDKNLLEDLWNSGQAPWKIWS